MDALLAFYQANRPEILTTLVAIVAIQVITMGGGFVSRRGGAKRVEGTGMQPPKENAP